MIKAIKFKKEADATLPFALLLATGLTFSAGQPHFGQITASSKSSFPHLEQYFIFRASPSHVSESLHFYKNYIRVFQHKQLTGCIVL